ncbi:hypothetical protein KGQ31_03110 [Patescibacteria group bacterium]|nr:hypothetical protein [Patescibacteria group bacterium]
MKTRKLLTTMLRFQNLLAGTMVVALKPLFGESLLEPVPKGTVGVIKYRNDNHLPQETTYEVLWLEANAERDVCRLSHSHLDPRVALADPLYQFR